MVQRLVGEGRVRLADPDDDEVAEWRRVVDYAKRHGLEPPGRRIEKVRFGARGWEMYLTERPHPNSRSQRPKGGSSVVPAPTRLGALQPAVAALRDNEKQSSRDREEKARAEREVRWRAASICRST
ncbi:hypothetical protein [Streptomyces iakyrus]|uniref:hypothetical protein n=1 Tax=Streptomyces iakyrus TaxID=68219 RepID=UPI0036F7EA9A